MSWIRRVLQFLVLAFAAIHLPLRADGEVMTYRTVGERDLSAYVFAPSHSRPADTVILLFHGGGYFTGTPESTFDAARAFSRAGATAIAIEYRLSDEEHTPLDALADACAATDWARDLPAPSKVKPFVVLYGVSAGAHLATNSVTHGCGDPREPPAALLLSSPGIDVLRHAPRFEEQLNGKAKIIDHAPLETMTEALPPLAIVHSEEDRIDPITTSQRLCRQQRRFKGRCKLLGIPRRGHLFSRNFARQIPGPGFDPDPQSQEQALEFFVKFLRDESLLPTED